MDLLVEKLDGSRYYLSKYKVLITEFEESAPTVTRNNMQLDQRNGNIDFGGWHKDKTINITGYYRADDMDEEEILREKLYALLSDPDGYYITQLKTSPDTAVERPGETSGNYYDKLTDYPSHKRFLVYTEAPELELVGNVNGTLIYKLTAEFKTMKLPYGETPAIDIGIDNMPYKDVPVNLFKNTGNLSSTSTTTAWGNLFTSSQIYDSGIKSLSGVSAMTFSFNVYIPLNATVGSTIPIQIKGQNPQATDVGPDDYNTIIAYSDYGYVIKQSDLGKTIRTSLTIQKSPNYQSFDTALADTDSITIRQRTGTPGFVYSYIKLETSSTASQWSPNPADPEYLSWYYKMDGTASIPYSGTVPCNQLEQQFAIELTAMGAASSLSFKINDTELTYSGAIAAGDVFLLTGFSYTQNGLSIVSKTNKAYFILQPNKPNRITCNVPGTVRIIGFQNLYA